MEGGKRMKVEYLFDAKSSTEYAPVAKRTIPVYYYYTGERVGPGRYMCTFCGSHVNLTIGRILSACQACDSSEFLSELVA
jgi:hypothetical protein